MILSILLDIILLHAILMIFVVRNRRQRLPTIGIKRPPLLSLNDDVLLVILDEVDRFSRRCGLPPDTRARRLRDKCHGYRSLVSFSSTNRRIRMLAEGHLFRNFRVCSSSWRANSAALDLIRDNYQAQKKIKSFHIALSTEAFLCFSPVIWKFLTGPASTLIKLATTLGKLEALRHLVIHIPEGEDAAFRETFERAEVRLPQVKSINIGLPPSWILEMCPSVESVETDFWQWHELLLSNDTIAHWRSYEDNLKHTPNLKHLTMCEYRHSGILDWILTVVPRVESIGLRCGNGTHELVKMLPLLEQFHHLKRVDVLDLNDSMITKPLRLQWSLDSTWTQQQQRRNCRFGIDERLQPLAQRLAERCISLTELTMGRSMAASVVRHQDGAVSHILWSCGCRRMFGQYRSGSMVVGGGVSEEIYCGSKVIEEYMFVEWCGTSTIDEADIEAELELAALEAAERASLRVRGYTFEGLTQSRIV